MKKLFLVSLLALAQAGVTYTPPVPPQPAKVGGVTIVAGALTCNVLGDTVPAAQVSITCTGSLVFPLTTFALPPGSNFTFVLGMGTDSAAILFNHPSGSPISFQATSTTAGVTTGPATTGTL